MHVHHHEKPVPVPTGWTLSTEKSAVPPKVCADDTYTHEFHLIKTMGANARNAWTQVTKLLQKFPLLAVSHP